MFFDRDGCLNVDTGFVHRWAEFQWLPGAREAIAAVNAGGWLAFVVTNQSGIARGLYSEEDVRELHSHMAADLARQGLSIHGFRFCPHHPDYPAPHAAADCRCRKPAPGMIVDLMRAWHVSPQRAFLVGDKETDVAAAKAAGIPGFLTAPGTVFDTVRRELKRRA